MMAPQGDEAAVLLDLYTLSRLLCWYAIGRHADEIINWGPAARRLHDALLYADRQYGIGFSDGPVPPRRQQREETP